MSSGQITGIVLLAIGATIKAVYMGYHVFLDDRYFSAPNLLIAVGLIILLVSFLGCCGAVKENHCMIVSVSAAGGAASGAGIVGGWLVSGVAADSVIAILQEEEATQSSEYCSLRQNDSPPSSVKTYI